MRNSVKLQAFTWLVSSSLRNLFESPVGTCAKDQWTKPKGSRIEDGEWGWVGRRGGYWGKMETTVL